MPTSVRSASASSTAARDALSATFAALADPTRRAILARLARGETTVTDLAQPFEMSMPAVTKHLKVLERAGLISRGRDAQWRPCRLDPAPLRAADDWIEQYRQLWEQRFDRLEEYLRGMQPAPEVTTVSTNHAASVPTPANPIPRSLEKKHARRKK